MEGLLAIIRLIGLVIVLFSLGTLGYALYAFWNHEILTSLFCAAWGCIGWLFSKMFLNIGG